MYPEPNRQSVPVVVRPARTCPNGLHFFMTLITLGLWFPIWMLDVIVCRFSKPKVRYY